MARYKLEKLTAILHPLAVLAWGAAIAITALLGRSAWIAVEEAERSAEYYSAHTDTMLN